MKVYSKIPIVWEFTKDVSKHDIDRRLERDGSKLGEDRDDGRER